MKAYSKIPLVKNLCRWLVLLWHFRLNVGLAPIAK